MNWYQTWCILTPWEDKTNRIKNEAAQSIIYLSYIYIFEFIFLRKYLMKQSITNETNLGQCGPVCFRSPPAVTEAQIQWPTQGFVRPSSIRFYESESPSEGGPSAPLRLYLRSPLPSPLVSCGRGETRGDPSFLLLLLLWPLCEAIALAYDRGSLS